MNTWFAIGFAAVAFFSTVAGGYAALRWPGRVQALAALAGGVVLGAAFFDLLPDAIERAAELNISSQLPVGFALVGFLGFYTLFEGPEGGGDVNLILKVHRGGKDVILYKDRNYLAEFEVVQPNEVARERFEKIHEKHGRRVGREFG